MRKRERVRCYFFVGFLLLAAEYAAAQQWNAFSSEDGRYSILTPGKALTGTASLQTAGSTVIAHTVTAISPSIDLMCGYYDFPSSQLNVEKVFDATRDGSINKVHGTLLTEEKIALDGYPGRRFRSTGIGNAFLDEEMFMVGQRFYLITITTATKEPNKNIAKILDSFRFKTKDP
jgi:hypothetical protein